MARPVSKAGFCRNVSAAAFTAFWSRGVMPTPFERISRTTCWTASSSGFGASVKRRCASSKKKTSFGLSRSPTSGSVSNSSDSIQTRNEA